MAPNVCRKAHEDLILEVIPKKVFMIFEGKICRQSRPKHFGQVWENSGKNPSHSQKFACSYTYGANHVTSRVLHM